MTAVSMPAASRNDLNAMADASSIGPVRYRFGLPLKNCTALHPSARAYSTAAA